MAAKLRSDKHEHSVAYMAGRFKKRLLSDCYGRGVTRAAVETTGLLTQSHPNNVCAAESMVSSLSDAFDGKLYLNVVEKKLGDDQRKNKHRLRASRAKPNSSKLIIERDEATMYGNRGDNPKVRWLSAFEFKRWVSLERSTWPGTSGEAEDELEFDKQSKPTGKFTARVTNAGRHKLVQMIEGQQVSMVP